ncbi:magnesium/cobalt transporter CorA [Halogranum rubrum]|uniref:Magnesium transport protein CorA n=1 Tax=Halogranum salarium B-1 TaxID=1210908 RepID=J2ZJZ1_9EURY|nr:magnesium and cobalt transport protein CorA [Halogranum salarium B-1]
MIEAMVYTAESVDRYTDLDRAKRADGTTWVRAESTDTEELQRVADVFGIHPLSVEDIYRDIRPKTEQFPNHTFVLVKTATLQRGETTFDEEIHTRQVGLFLGPDWLVTLAVDDVEAVRSVWNNIEDGESRARRFGPDFTAYRVVDRVVDGYFLLLDDVETTIEAIEDGILGGPDPDVLEALNAVRRDLLSFRKVVWPTREAVNVLARGDPDEVRDTTEKYYRDVYDHLVQLADLTETYRDLARGARDIYQNAVAQSTNEVMKRLTVVATIILPLTLVVGIFGMNFSGGAFNMPELTWAYGYPAVMLGMAAVSFVLLAYFRREGWL